MAPIRVLMVSVSPSLGGAPRTLLDITRHLDRKRFAPAVLIGSDGPGVAEFSRIAPTFSYRASGLRTAVLRRGRRLDWIFKGLWVRREVARLKPDVIFNNTIGGRDLYRFSRSLHVPKIMLVQGIYVEHICEGDPYMNWIAQFADHYIGTSEHVSDVLHTCLGVDRRKVSTIYAGIDVDAVLANCKADPMETRGALGFRASDFVIGACGGLVIDKGPDLLIEAAGLLRDRHPDRALRFLWIGGANPNHSRLARALSARVRELGLADSFQFLGQKNPPYDYVNVLDVFAMCSRQECLPLAALEAMLLRKPVVGFHEGGVPEQLAGGVGRLVSPITPQAFADAISDLIDDPAMRQDMGRAGFKTVRERFDTARNTPRYEEVIASVAAARNGAR